MPLETNQDDYLKFYIDESLPLFDKINKIIKKGESMQRQALINNLLKDSISSSDSDLSNKGNSDDEKNDDSKKNGKINNKNRLKNSIAPDNSNIENLMNKKDIYIKIAIIISDILTIMMQFFKLTLTFGYSKNDNSLEELVMN